MKKTIRVIYDGRLDVRLDMLIRTAMEKIGAELYAEGYNFEDEERDICFDWGEEE